MKHGGNIKGGTALYCRVNATRETAPGATKRGKGPQAKECAARGRELELRHLPREGEMRGGVERGGSARGGRRGLKRRYEKGNGFFGGGGGGGGGGEKKTWQIRPDSISWSKILREEKAGLKEGSRRHIPP